MGTLPATNAVDVTTMGMGGAPFWYMLSTVPEMVVMPVVLRVRNDMVATRTGCP